MMVGLELIAFQAVSAVAKYALEKGIPYIAEKSADTILEKGVSDVYDKVKSLLSGSIGENDLKNFDANPTDVEIQKALVKALKAKLNSDNNQTEQLKLLIANLPPTYFISTTGEDTSIYTAEKQVINQGLTDTVSLSVHVDAIRQLTRQLFWN